MDTKTPHQTPPHLFGRIQSLRALFFSFGVMIFGHGLLNTVVGLRANVEGYSDLTIGIMTSCYFLGFIFGARICAGLVPKVGHIRCFTIFASVASALTLALIVHVDPVTWIVVRFLYGACIAALYTVMESWLNLMSKNEERGQTLSIYMIVSGLSIALSQGVMSFFSAEGFVLFAVASLLLSLSLVPVAASRTPQPQDIAVDKLSLKQLWKTSNSATLGVFTTGVVNGSFWGFGPIYLSDIGMTDSRVGYFIGALYFGGLCLQWPIGYLSDKINRLKAIVVLIFFSSVVSFYLYGMSYSDETMVVLFMFLIGAFFWGGVNNTLHSLYLAYANDFLKPTQVVSASAGLLSIHAMGAIVGPLFATVFVSQLGARGLVFFTGVFTSFIFLFMMYRLYVGRKPSQTKRKTFIPVPNTGVLFAKLDPRRKKG